MASAALKMDATSKLRLQSGYVHRFGYGHLRYRYFTVTVTVFVYTERTAHVSRCLVAVVLTPSVLLLYDMKGLYIVGVAPLDQNTVDIFYNLVYYCIYCPRPITHSFNN